MNTLFPKGKKPLIIGTEIYSRKSSDVKQVEASLNFAVESNFLGVDSAECYGTMDKVIGDASGGWGDEFILCTKFGHVGSPSEFEDSFSLASVISQLKASLRDLKSGHIDIYYFHSGSNSQFLQPEIWEYLKSKKADGAIKHLGLSIKHDLVKNRDYVQVDAASKYGISVLQTVLNPIHRQSTEYVIQAARSQEIAVVGRMPLSKGLIPKLSVTEVETLVGPNFRLKERIETHWKTHHLNESRLADAIKIGLTLSWCLERVDAVVLAHSSLDQLRMSATVIDAITRKDVS